MLFSFLTFLRRFIYRNYLVSFLKSFGLWLGLLVFVIVFLIHSFHYSYDDWNPHLHEIYKVSFQSKGSDYMGSDKYGVTSAALAPVVNEKLPQVEYAIRINEISEILLKTDNDAFMVEEAAAMDPRGVSLFGLKFIQGNIEAFHQPYALLLSASAASKLFGDQDPIGKVIHPESYYHELSPFTVVGVYKDIPHNSTFNYDYIFPFEDYITDINPNSLEQWGNRNYYTFFKIPKGNDLEQIESISSGFRNENQDNASQNDFRYFLQPLADLHFSEGINFEIGTPIQSKNLDALLLIGLIILLISAFNAVNLSIAETFKRQKEMGVRKSIGASRRQIITQYLFESTLQMVLVTGLVALSLQLVLPVINSYQSIPLTPFDNPLFIPLLLLLILAIVLLTSAYPAFILSRFQPGKHLKSSVKTQSGFFGLRNILVVIQFFLAGGLMVISIGIYQQLNFLMDTDPGFQREGIMVVRIRDRDIRSDEEVRRTIKLQALEHAQIDKVAYSSQLPNRITSQNGRKWIDESGQERNVSLYTLIVEPEMMDIYGIQMQQGRTFGQDFSNNKGRYILNEAAVKEIGIENILNQTFIEYKDTIEIVGIMKDFHGLSMHQPIRPTRFSVEEISWWGYCSIQFRGDPKPVQEHICKLFNEYSDFPVTAELFDDNYLKMYEEEQQSRAQIALLTGLAIFISCLGLFGLLLNAFENRQLELGIRKTLGGAMQHLGWVLSRRLLVPIGIAWVLAMPVATILLESWLSDFAFRVTPGASIFIYSALFLLVSLTISLCYMLIRISRLSPVEILKME